MKKTGTKFRATVVVAGASAILILGTACGSNTPSGSETGASGAASATASESAKNTVAGSSVNGFATKKELAKDSQGREYVQTTLSATDPLLSYDRMDVTEQTSGMFTPEEIAAAQKEAGLYFAEEVTDSILKGDGITKADEDLWWETNKDKFDPEQVGEIIAALHDYDSKNTPVYRNPARAEAGYSLEYSVDKIQVLQRQMGYSRIVSLTKDEKKYIGFNADIYFEIPVSKAAGNATEKVVANGQVVMRQVSPGDWKIAGTTISVNSVEYTQ